MEGPIDRVVRSGGNEGKNASFRMLAQARDGVVLCCDGQHWHFNLEVFDKVD